ncbi:MAG: hypothetical protein QM781_15025 [Chitinophagaceae bacterium]
MKKKLFFTGSVFRFYIPEIGKYGFCKFFDFKHLSVFHGLLAQVFDKFTDTEDNTIDDLKTCDWLFGPRSIYKWPDLKKDTGWKLLGILNSAKDDFVPDFKEVQAFPTVVEDESKKGPWYPIHNLTQRGENCNYGQVKHLEQIILTPTIGLILRTGMEYCRINGLNVGDYYDLSKAGIKSTYLQMINVPIYSTIPYEIRGKSIV